MAIGLDAVEAPDPGAELYRCLTGQMPGVSRTAAAVMAAVLLGEPPRADQDLWIHRFFNGGPETEPGRQVARAARRTGGGPSSHLPGTLNPI